MNSMFPYFLASTGDQTDRSKEIEKLLSDHKAALLGTGKFYVSGIKMPAGTSIFGLGAASEIVLLPEVEEGAAVELSTRCTVKNLAFTGHEGEFPRPTEVGTRHGICFLGEDDPADRKAADQDILLSDLFIQKFSGGGITCIGTGYNIDCSISATNMRIHGCGAGLNIAYFSEFHKFTNIHTTRNLYGCINNGGNNVFSACSFDGNTIGFLIDNSEKKSPNHGHGTVVGCTFQHSGGNHGTAIELRRVTIGYHFSACQLGGGKIIAENCKGIDFSGFRIGGGVKIEALGKTAMQFSDCVFASPAEIYADEEARVDLIDCRDKTAEKFGFENLISGEKQ